MSKETIIILVLIIFVILVVNLLIKKEGFYQIIKSVFCFNKFANHNIFETTINCPLDPIGRTGETSSGIFYDDLNQCLNICGNCTDCKGFSDYEDGESGLRKCEFKNDTSEFNTETGTGLKATEGTDIYIMKKCEFDCKKKGEAGDKPLCHSKENCRSHPFDFYPECEQELDPDIPDIHVQRQNDTKIFSNIHYVNPFNPCCLRNCINDFTYANKDEANKMGVEFGAYKSNIPIDMLFSSKCAQCLLRFEPALNMIKNPEKCEVTSEEN